MKTARMIWMPLTLALLMAVLFAMPTLAQIDETMPAFADTYWDSVRQEQDPHFQPTIMVVEPEFDPLAFTDAYWDAWREAQEPIAQPVALAADTEQPMITFADVYWDSVRAEYDLNCQPEDLLISAEFLVMAAR